MYKPIYRLYTELYSIYAALHFLYLADQTEVYRELINEPSDGVSEAVTHPRNLKQVQNIRLAQNQSLRISRDSIYNLNEIAHQLKLGERHFIRKIQTFPHLTCAMMSHPVSKFFSRLLKATDPDEPVELYYDTTYKMGDYYVSTLTFRHTFFVGDPCVPLAFLIHTRRFHDDHTAFLELVRSEIPGIDESRINFISDREFRLHKLWPNTEHLVCWLHLQKDFEFWLRTKTCCDPATRRDFLNDLRNFLECETALDFQALFLEVEQMDRWRNNKDVSAMYNP